MVKRFPVNLSPLILGRSTCWVSWLDEEYGYDFSDSQEGNDPKNEVLRFH
jgi:hypothetical protein